MAARRAGWRRPRWSSHSCQSFVSVCLYNVLSLELFSRLEVASTTGTDIVVPVARADLQPGRQPPCLRFPAATARACAAIVAPASSRASRTATRRTRSSELTRKSSCAGRPAATSAAPSRQQPGGDTSHAVDLSFTSSLLRPLPSTSSFVSSVSLRVLFTHAS